MTDLRISGNSFTVQLGTQIVKFLKCSAKIEDEREVVYEHGLPVGYTNGKIACSGSFELSSREFKVLEEMAKTEGSWRQVKPFDILCSAMINERNGYKVKLYGCLIKLTDLMDADSNSADQTVIKLDFDVTSPYVCAINDISYPDLYDVSKVL